MFKFLSKLFGKREETKEANKFIGHEVSFNVSPNEKLKRSVSRVYRLVLFKQQSPQYWTSDHGDELEYLVAQLKYNKIVFTSLNPEDVLVVKLKMEGN